jgi:hypothetical protein
MQIQMYETAASLRFSLASPGKEVKARLGVKRLAWPAGPWLIGRQIASSALPASRGQSCPLGLANLIWTHGFPN